MKQVFDTWKVYFGKNAIISFFFLACILVILTVLYRSIKSRVNLKKLSLICVICAAGFIFAWRQPYLSEKAHVLEYGVLGWLAVRDLVKDKGNILKSLFYALIFVAIIGSLDEGYQKLLPWRVCEIRDIVTNVLSGALGIVLFILR